MNTYERFRASFKGEPVDRPPICGWIALPLLTKLTGIPSGAKLLEAIVDDPRVVIDVQERLGLDPILVTVDDRWFSMHDYWRLIYSFDEEQLGYWQVKQELLEDRGTFKTWRFTVETPDGPIAWSYEAGENQVAELERPLKEESDLDLLEKYMPPPEALVQDKLKRMVEIANGDAFVTHNYLGIWGEAANMRGLVELCTDLYDRPEFVKRVSEWLMNRSIRRVKHLAQTGVHSILYDQSWIGVGLSPATYREFVLPYDTAVVQAAQEEGILVSYHNCGRGMAILEDMVETGADALETLTPKISSGDFDLAEVKRRVGDRITLNGGFNERIFANGSPADIREAVARCLDAGGDRYILRTTGQIFDAPPGTIEAFAEAGRELGAR
jgi:uroporphyrinogen-III decarboxylase